MPRFHVDPKNDAAPSEQIAEQVRFAVASESLTPGERLPSVRAMAVEIVVNPNTVAKAYRQLEWEGIVEPRMGDGVFVSMQAPSLCVGHRNRVLRERLTRWLDEAGRAGLSHDELLQWFESQLSKRRSRNPAKAVKHG